MWYCCISFIDSHSFFGDPVLVETGDVLKIIFFVNFQLLPSLLEFYFPFLNPVLDLGCQDFVVFFFCFCFFFFLWSLTTSFTACKDSA